MSIQPPPYTPSAPTQTYPPNPPYPPYQPQGPYVQYTSQQVTTTQPISAVTIIRTNGCPKCTIGTIVETFTLPGICCAVWFFPIGLLCCMTWKRRLCNNCGAVYN